MKIFSFRAASAVEIIFLGYHRATADFSRCATGRPQARARARWRDARGAFCCAFRDDHNRQVDRALVYIRCSLHLALGVARASERFVGCERSNVANLAGSLQPRQLQSDGLRDGHFLRGVRRASAGRSRFHRRQRQASVATIVRIVFMIVFFQLHDVDWRASALHVASHAAER